MRFAYSSDIYDNAFDYLGMLPIALGLGAGAELRQSMGVVLVGGLTTSTLLTLVVSAAVIFAERGMERETFA